MAVDKHRFEEMFDQLVFSPLENLGYERSGKSIFLVQEDIAVSLIRLGGRSAYPGSISQILCFRHSFLPNLDGEANLGFEREVFSYPVKLKPLAIMPGLASNFRYYPSSSHYEGETFEFLNRSERQVSGYLSKVRKGVDIFHNFAHEITPDILAKEIGSRGESAWVENLWLNSYASRQAI